MSRLSVTNVLCLWQLSGCGVDMSRYSLSMSSDTAYWPRDYEWDGPPGSEGNPAYHGDIDIDLNCSDGTDSELVVGRCCDGERLCCFEL